MKVAQLLVFVILLSSLRAQKHQKPETTITSEKSAVAVDINDLNLTDGLVAGLIKRYTADRASLNRFYSAPFSPVRRARFSHLYENWLNSLRSMNFEMLSQQEKVDYLLFKNYLDHELLQLDIEAKRFAEMESLVPFAVKLIDLEDSRRLMQPADPPKIAALMNTLNKKIQEIRKSVDASLKSDGKSSSKLKKTVANRAYASIGSFRNMLKNWFGFYNGYDPNFTWWVGQPYKMTDSLMQDYAKFLREKVVGVRTDDPTAIVGDPIGREALLIELKYEMIPYTPEELVALARKEMEWCEKEMIRASQDLGFGNDWHKALEHVKNLYVHPGKQPELIRELALEAIDFVENNNLLTVPALAKQSWRMEMMSPERQLIAPFFLGGEVIQVSYPTNSMSHEAKMMSMRGNNPHFSRATVHHELIPGHHLQGFMTERYRPYRGIFRTPFWGEGWALYWELMLWDMNFPKSPENRVGMLFWRMHRCARIIFSLSFHLEQMTPEQSIDLLVNKVGHEYDNAAAEVRRSFSGQYGPLYQCAYLLGGLQFRSLQHELVGSGKMSNKEFHDTILRNNSIPVEMVRALLTNQELKREHTPQWKFYGTTLAK
ncbi:MAG: DUF885 family protein [Ignavibacteriales bacterium]|nr:DUF885 family protein [Ignavibacteriales bacterium]